MVVVTDRVRVEDDPRTGLDQADAEVGVLAAVRETFIEAADALEQRPPGGKIRRIEKIRWHAQSVADHEVRELESAVDQVKHQRRHV